MTLVFLSRSRLPVHNFADDECKLVADKYGTSVAGVTQALEQLEGAFLVKREDGGQPYWSYFHPTFADAVSGILSSRPDLVELYVKGAKTETLLAEVVCEGAQTVQDAVLIPSRYFDSLVERLIETPNERELNEQLFRFLDRRAPDSIVASVLKADPGFFGREGSPNRWMGIDYHGEVLIHAKAHAMGLLPDSTRWNTYELLKRAAFGALDVSFLSNERILAILQPHELMRLSIKLVDMLEKEIPSQIDDLSMKADPDSDIDDQFSRVESFVSELQSIHVDGDGIASRLCELQHAIDDAKSKVEARKSAEEGESFFTGVPSASVPRKTKDRSIFSDLDE